MDEKLTSWFESHAGHLSSSPPIDGTVVVAAAVVVVVVVDRAVLNVVGERFVSCFLLFVMKQALSQEISSSKRIDASDCGTNDVEEFIARTRESGLSALFGMVVTVDENSWSLM